MITGFPVRGNPKPGVRLEQHEPLLDVLVRVAYKLMLDTTATIAL